MIMNYEFTSSTRILQFAAKHDVVILKKRDGYRRVLLAKSVSTLCFGDDNQ